MGEKSELIASMLVGKTPDQIEKLFAGVERTLRFEAEEAAEQAQAQAARDGNMSLDEVELQLNRANASCDFDGIRKWGDLHRERLAWVTDKLESDEVARLAKANAPIIEERQKHREALERELAALTQPGAQINFDRIGAVQDELRGLS